MSKRKQTPDVLAEILGGDLAGPVQTTPVVVGRRPSARATRPAVVKSNPPKPKGWEYMIVSFQEYRGWRLRFIDGVELKDWMAGPQIYKYLETIGAEGWELVSASAGERMYGNQDKRQVFFKRPK
jgi:hypothetical protein